MDIYFFSKTWAFQNMPSVGCLHTSAPPFKLFLMCNHVFLHNSSQGGPRRVRSWASITRPRTRRRRHVASSAGAHAHPMEPPADITCFTRTPEKGGRREIWQALTFPFQLQKIHPPSKCQDALYTQFRSKAQIYHRNYIKHAWIPGAVSVCCVCISRQMFSLHFLIIWHTVWFVRTYNLEAVWDKSINMWLLSAVGMGTSGIYSRCSNHRLGMDPLKLRGRKVEASEPPACWQDAVNKSGK